MILFFLFGIKTIQIIREKEKFQDEKHYEKLNKDNKPKRPTYGHSLEAIQVETIDSRYNITLSHTF
jgi:hypothetical protein